MDNEILELYKSILNMANLAVDENGKIINLLHDTELALADGTVAHLPYFEQLKNPAGKEWFHLLNEDSLEPFSEVYTLYKKYLILTMNLRLSTLATSIITIGSNPNTTRLLKTAEAMEFFKDIPDLKMSQVKIVEKMFKKALEQDKSAPPFFDIFIKKKGVFKGEDYTAIGTINFKVYNELKTNFDNGVLKPYNIAAISKTDSKAIMAVFEAIFPGIERDDVYVGTTRNQSYRCLDALLKATYIVGNRINTITNLIGPELVTDTEILMSDLNWAENIDEMPKKIDLIRSIRVQSKQPVEAVVAGQQTYKPDFSIPKQDPVVQAPVQQAQAPQPQVQQAPVYNPGMPPVQPPVNAYAPNPAVAPMPSATDIFMGRAPMPLTPYQQMAQQQQQMIGGGQQMPQWILREEQQKQAAVYQQQMQNFYQQNPNVYNPQGAVQQPGYNPQGYPQQPVYAPQPVYAQPAYNPQTGYVQPGYPQQPVYAQPAYNPQGYAQPQYPVNGYQNPQQANHQQSALSPQELATGGNPQRSF